MPSPSSPTSLPEFREWSIPAVHLLRGVVYADNTQLWTVLMRSLPSLETYFARIGLQVIIDETEGYAYLRQYSSEECLGEYEQLPKLVRRISLGYSATLLAVLLRDELRRFDEQELHNERCVLEVEVLFEQWKAFFPMSADEVRQRSDFKGAVARLSELGYLRKFGDNPEAYEIRRIIKARLGAAELESLRAQLAAVAAERGPGAVEADNG